MGLFSFARNAGEKLFGGKAARAAQEAIAPTPIPVRRNTAMAQPAQAAPASAAQPAPAPNPAEQHAAAIRAHIEKQDLGLVNLDVVYADADGRVTLHGEAPSQAAAEKAMLAAGNVADVAEVDNQLSYPAEEPTQWHDVVRGDTLSAIAKKYYGDASKYPVIFEANKPMLSHPGNAA